jgi:hypothetical protein
MAGSGEGKAEFVEHRQKLVEERSALEGAASQGDLAGVRTHLGSIRSRLGAIESRSSAMNMLDRQHVALQIATARRTMTETERWIDAGDADAVRTEVGELGGILHEVDTILDRTIRGSNPDAPATG